MESCMCLPPGHNVPSGAQSDRNRAGFAASCLMLRSRRSMGGKPMAGSVGFIGLGNMGGQMALNLVKAGFELVVHDINPARLEPLVAAGATAEASPEAVAARCHR